MIRVAATMPSPVRWSGSTQRGSRAAIRGRAHCSKRATRNFAWRGASFLSGVADGCDGASLTWTSGGGWVRAAYGPRRRQATPVPLPPRFLLDSGGPTGRLRRPPWGPPPPPRTTHSPGPFRSTTGGCMAVFNGVDFLRFDDLLTEEEKTIRQAVRDWVEEKFLPIVEHHYEAATFPTRAHPADGRARPARREPPGRVRLRRHRRRRLRARHAGARARRLGPALVRLGAGRARHVPDLRLRLRGAARVLAAASWPAARRSAASA